MDKQGKKSNGLFHLSVENDRASVAVLSPSIQHVFATGLGSCVEVTVYIHTPRMVVVMNGIGK